jgi:hypothetical protein
MILRLLQLNKKRTTKKQSNFIDDQKPPGFFLTILWCGFLVGWLDIIAAFINTWFPYHVGPIVVLRFIASGLLGRAAFGGGKEMAVYGLIIHFLIAYTFTIFFFMVYPRMKILAKNWILTGVVYGILIWIVMNLIVVPITLIPKGHFQPAQVAIGMGILVFMIGLPLSYMTKQFYKDAAKR